MDRRGFLRTAIASTAAWSGMSSLARHVLAAEDAALAEQLQNIPAPTAPRLQMREYGKTGVKLSIIGFPGFCLRDVEMNRVVRLVGEAHEMGMNYFDVAPLYGDAEQRLGPALEPYRKNVFLSCKTNKRTADEAAFELDRSMKRLRTDYLDLYQLHHITDVEKDVDRSFAKGGAMEVLIKARKEGRVRFLGFSAHSVEAAMTAMDRFDFDSAMVPVNLGSMKKGGFGDQILRKCEEKGVAVLALKAMALQKWQSNDDRRPHYPRCWYDPASDYDTANLSIRFTLDQGAVSALPPADNRLHRMMLMLGMDYKPLDETDRKRADELAETLDPLFVHKHSPGA